MQRGHSSQTAPSEHSQTWPQRGDPGLPPTLFPKPASGWVNAGLLRGVGQDPGGASAGWGPGCGGLTGCAQLCPQPSCTAGKPPALLPRHLRGAEPCPACVQEMEKPSRCSAPTAAGKLLAAVEMLSPPAQRLCRAGAQPALPRPVAHTAFTGRRGTGGAPGPRRTYQSPRRAQEAAAEESHHDTSHRARCLHGATVSLGRGPQGPESLPGMERAGVFSRTEHLLGAPCWLPAPLR